MTTETTGKPNHRKSLRDFEPQLSHFRKSSALRSLWQLSSTLTLFVALWAAMYWSLSISYWLTLLLAVPTSLLVVRLFIFQHDCGHRSFFKSKKANDLVGSFLGIITFTPYHAWRREHASHHATSGDLDRRGKSGEIWTMTVDEFNQAGWFRRLRYRAYRNPLVLFGLGPLYQFVIHHRLAFALPSAWKMERRSINQTNLGLLLTAIALSWLVGPVSFLIVQLPIIGLAAFIGVWMFYVQHQFEEAVWESGENWDYVQAALGGSSYYRLPKILQWFTGNIGLHHIHHLDSRIPNYNLQSCHDTNPEFQQVKQLSLLESLSCAKLRLWDERRHKMVGFDAAA